jgi:hypothetical protein
MTTEAKKKVNRHNASIPKPGFDISLVTTQRISTGFYSPRGSYTERSERSRHRGCLICYCRLRRRQEGCTTFFAPGRVFPACMYVY